MPEENLLALAFSPSSNSSLSSPWPSFIWDQTLWNLGTATNGQFTGQSQATFYISPQISTPPTQSSILGLATDIGQIRMQFTSGSSTTVGIGQFRNVNGQTAMEMQMVSGSVDTVLVSHWAYMLPYDPATFTPPNPLPNLALTSTEWAWTLNTHWNLQIDSIFGPGGSGSFTITEYRNGYFWGSGTWPAGSSGQAFTPFGSITPEGNVLFNFVNPSGSLISLTGQITGDHNNGMMFLRNYEFSGNTPVFGPVGIASLVVVPVPGSATLLAVAAVTLELTSRVRKWWHFRSKPGEPLP